MFSAAFSTAIAAAATRASENATDSDEIIQALDEALDAVDPSSPADSWMGMSLVSLRDMLENVQDAEDRFHLVSASEYVADTLASFAKQV